MPELDGILKKIERYIKIYQMPPLGREVVGTVELLEECRNIIRKHMNGDSPCGKCSRRKWYTEGYQDALKECSVNESFLKDCKQTAQKYQRDNDGWIPIYDRLPISDKEVWVTVKRKGKVFTSTDSMTEKGNFWNYDKENILAWREKELIPEPYHPERNEE